MAMISCPECNNTMSDQADACPNCGYPLRKPKRSGMPPVAIGCLVAAIGIPFVIAIIGLLAAIGIPSFHMARSNAMDKVCINNMRILNSAQQQHALVNNLPDGTVISEQELDAYIKGGFAGLTCPKGGTYILHGAGTAPECTEHGSIETPIY